ncbi:MAG: hypothetical protein A3G81_04495 [Betaproteobacteria bacterium RIFCSPLOWO2_12_FULL_65_14]|nr:MAG: hypothetical protein A3G81_04495 [Betaproteobacteria bacterium RIFCSPLOWO2_12_FULL_65_14]
MALPARVRNSLALILLAAGCAGGPQAPDWQANAAQALQAYQRLYFAGSTDAAEAQFKTARNELASTGRADLVARAELVRCAVRAASLEFDDCPGFEKLRDGAAAPELAYADYLAGRGRHAASDDPLSRLVAAAVQLKSGGISPAGISTAIDIASVQGWRRPLLAWLGVQLKRAEAAGDNDAASRLRKRIELVSE